MKLNSLKLLASRKLLVVRKYSPEILVGVGIVGLVTATVLACKASTKAEAVLEVAKTKLDGIAEARERALADSPTVIYTEDDRRQDLVIVHTQTAVDFAKLYGPAVLLGAVSIACIIGSHNIMRKRNIALIAAYAALDDGFKKYRTRVVEDLGIDKDIEYKLGTKAEKMEVVTTDPETGKIKKSKKEVATVDPNDISVYARFFDEQSPNWCKTSELNLTFLKFQQNYANDRLHSMGHLFLNEVYESLGLPHTKAGAVVGWVLDKDNDNFVDFGIFNRKDIYTRGFVNGTEPTILLDFNVDGVIFDKI